MASFSFGEIQKSETARCFVVAVMLAALTLTTFHAYRVHGESEILTVSIQSSLTFAATTDNFGALNPGTYETATTTLSVSTNNAAGWNVTLSGDDQSDADTTCDLDTDAAVGITDQTEWIPGAATTSVGNAVARASLDSSGDVLAFRVMTASGSTPFISTAWWGSDDADGNALWAGVSSSTAANLKVGDAGLGSFDSNAHLNTVQYYLDVPLSQQTGDYSCPLTYTATAN